MCSLRRRRSGRRPARSSRAALAPTLARTSTIDSAFDALTVYLTLDKISFLGLATELRDGLVSARGDQAQCDAITIRRLHLIGDRYASQPLPTALTPRHTRPWAHGLTVARGTESRPTGRHTARWPPPRLGIDLIDCHPRPLVVKCTESPLITRTRHRSDRLPLATLGSPSALKFWPFTKTDLIDFHPRPLGR